ncbi:MAG: RNA polymerase sigma factor [Bacteroidales bacterium]|nr:RNA polymerase sigma factor [Bacteroidales bacterium]MCB9013851.1 RNA polymerase sigma factor [Bacteroidales bacterium]
MHDDRYYIKQILNGDSSGFAVLVDRHKKAMYSFALKMVKVPEDAEEIAHDAFVKAYQSLGKFRQESKFSTWLFRIVFNECVSRLRKKKVESISFQDPKFQFHEAEEPVNFLKELEANEQKEMVLNALEVLPYDERSLISLFYMQDCSVKEIAEITGYSESNIKVKLFRARKRLWEKLRYSMSEKTSIYGT